MAVVGAGWAAGQHLEGYRRAGAELVGVFSRTRSRAEALADRYGVAAVTDSLDELLTRTEPDLVSIASPPAAHRAQILEAVGAGCHVLCDKPVGLTADEVAEMLTAARESGIRHATGFVLRSDPGLRRMRELIRDGRIGRVREVHSTCALGAPRMAMHWLYDDTAGGGSLMQFGTHVIDLLRWLLDAEFTALCGRLSHDVRSAPVGPEFPTTLDALAWARFHHGRDFTRLPQADVTADVGYDVLAELSTGVRARLWQSMHLTGLPKEEVTVTGDDGSLVWSGTGALTLRRIGRRDTPIPVDGVPAPGPATAAETGLRRWESLVTAFIETVLSDAAGEGPDLTDGWHVARVVDAVGRSHITRRWEEV